MEHVRPTSNYLYPLKILLRFSSKIEFYPINENFVYCAKSNNKYIGITTVYYILLVCVYATITSLMDFWNESGLLRFDIVWMSICMAIISLIIYLVPVINYFKTIYIAEIFRSLKTVGSILKCETLESFPIYFKIRSLLSVNFFVALSLVSSYVLFTRHPAMVSWHLFTIFAIARYYINFDIICLVNDNQLVHLDVVRRSIELRPDALKTVKLLFCLSRMKSVLSKTSRHLGPHILNYIFGFILEMFLNSYQFYILISDTIFPDFIIIYLFAFSLCVINLIILVFSSFRLKYQVRKIAYIYV